MLVHLGLKDTELVHFGLICHTQFTIQPCPSRQSGPEIRKFINKRCVVAYGLSQVTDAIVQQCTVINSHEILRLHLHNEVKIGQCTVVVAKLNAQQSAVIVGQKITWIEVNGKVIVGHCSPEVVQIQPGKRTVYIVIGHLWPQVNNTGKARIGRFPLLFVQRNIRACSPGIGVIGVNSKTLCQPFVGLHRIFLFEIYLGFQRIGIGNVGPSFNNGISIEQRLLVILHVQTAYCPVHPEGSHARIQPYGLIIIGYGSGVFFLMYARNGPYVEYLLNIRVQLYGVRSVRFSPNVIV